MEARERSGSTQRGVAALASGLPLLVLFVVLLVIGCVRVHVDTQGRADARFEDYETVLVLPVVVHENAIEAGGALTRKIEARALEGLVARGYAAGETADAQLAIQLVAEVQRSLRRTWSSDPDANSTVLREIDEALLTLRAVDRRRDVEVWRGEARTRLRDEDLLFSGGPDSTWTGALDELLEAVPAR